MKHHLHITVLSKQEMETCKPLSTLPTPHEHVIGFVNQIAYPFCMQSSDPHLSHSQAFIYNAILSRWVHKVFPTFPLTLAKRQISHFSVLQYLQVVSPPVHSCPRDTLTDQLWLSRNGPGMTLTCAVVRDRCLQEIEVVLRSQHAEPTSGRVIGG